MKRFIAITICLLALSLMWACEDNPAREYGNALTAPLKRADRAADRANLDALRKSVSTYRATNGQYPASLDEVATGLDTSRYDYDPATGNVTLK